MNTSNSHSLWRAALLAPVALFIAVLPVSAQSQVDPAKELASFQLPAGFQANLFASEADGVAKPIQMRWDARGRLWVICSTAYPLIKPGEEARDQVLILEDVDGDGKSDKTIVFDHQLMIPTGLELDADGHGAWVGEGTKLWHLRDTDGDDRADSREVVLRGFGTGDNHQNLNSFRWSPGGDLFFCQGLHAFSRVETPRGIVSLNEAGFWRYRPRTGELDAFYGGKLDPQNPWGWAWTDGGQPLLVAGNNGGIFYPLPEMVRGHDETRVGNIWVDPKTRKSSGPDIVGTAHLPPEWQGVFLTGGYMNNAVWALKVEDDGAGFRLTDLPPLVTSSHSSFRAVDVKIGPEGAIYLCDWYNPIIGHYQASFRHPDRDKTHGRIWRITHKDRPLLKQPPIAGAEIAQLLENLRSPERWTREQSKRTLLAREAAAVVQALGAWTTALKGEDAGTEHALQEALGVYEALNFPTPTLVERLLKAHSADARAYAVGVVPRWAQHWPQPLSLLQSALAEEHPRVRLAAVVALGNLDQLEGLDVLLAVGKKPMDRFLKSALHHAVLALKPKWLPALRAGTLKIEAEAISLLVQADGTPDTVVLLRQLLTNRELEPEQRLALSKALADAGDANDIATLLDGNAWVYAERYDLASHAALMDHLAESSRKTRPANSAKLLGGSLESLDDTDIHPLVVASSLRLAGAWKLTALEQPLLLATAEARPMEIRLAGVEGLARLGSEKARARLLELSDDPDLPFRTAAVVGLARVDLVEAAKQAVGNIFAAEGTPEAVATLLPAFLERKDGATILARELREQSPPPRPILAKAALQHLRNLGRQDLELLEVLTKISGTESKAVVMSTEWMETMVEDVQEQGNAKRGEEIFRRAELSCIACHAVGGKGGNIGPSLDSIGSGQPLDFIIGAILQPQREVKESFEAVEVTTKDNRLVQGYRVRETKTELVLRDVAQGTETVIGRDQVAARREIGSLMPAGLVDQLSREHQRDLFKYLSTLGKPK